MLDTPQRPELRSRFAALIGEAHVIADPQGMQPYLTEPRDLFHGRAALVLRPGSTEEVAAVVRLAAETGTPIVPQGGVTGLVGGSVPDASGAELVVSTARLNRIRSIDPDGDTLIAESGVTLAAVQAAAAAVDRLFPLSLAAEGTCTIGGNLGTNAGGTAFLAYGGAREMALGLEVVLPDGRIWHGLRTLRKDNTGYDLKHLFIGSEGTLGIITAASLKLFPRPRRVETAFVGLDSPAAALALFRRLRQTAGNELTTLELMPRIGLDFVLRYAGSTRDPLSEPHPWYLLVELSSPRDADLATVLEGVLGGAIEDGLAQDAAIARSLAEREALWRLRESLPEVQRYEGGSIKHDVSVPVSRVPDFIAEASAAVAALVPGARPVPFGHVGDGNVHFNVSQPVGGDKAGFLARWDEVADAVHAIVARYGGSVSAEHGIGRLKKKLLPAVKDPVELALMRELKQALDPRGLLNPGVLF